MSTLKWKVRRPSGELVAAASYAEDAAAMVAHVGAGAKVTYDHRVVVWREGSEQFSAADSFDGAAAVTRERFDAFCAGGRS
jgi:hypothetical protein